MINCAVPLVPQVRSMVLKNLEYCMLYCWFEHPRKLQSVRPSDQNPTLYLTERKQRANHSRTISPMNDKHDYLYNPIYGGYFLKHSPTFSQFDVRTFLQHGSPHDGRPWHHHAFDLPQWRASNKIHQSTNINDTDGRFLYAHAQEHLPVYSICIYIYMYKYVLCIWHECKN